MTSIILTFEDQFPERSLVEHVARNPSSGRDRTMPTGTIAIGPAVQARVNHGRWIADCPTPECTGAELVNTRELAFFCCECRNAEWKHDLLPVLMPPPMTRHDVEAYLRARPAIAMRNWRPGEKVAGLRDENRANNISLLPEDR